MKKIGFLLFITGIMLNVNAATINIVAAENFYGELAKEIGGNQVNVQSIISNPDADPHLFTTSPSTSKSLSQAQIIIYNGADYDNWINQMIAGIDKKKVVIINVADLVGVKSGENPHLWYKPATFPKLAKILADKISAINPSGSIEVSQNLTTFIKEHDMVVKMINNTRSKYAGTPVTATELVYGYMAEAMGLKMQGIDFQWKVMNDTEPTPKMIAAYQELLTRRQVKVLFYNSQVSDSITKNMQDLARKNNIPVVGVTETMPAKVTVNQWLTNEVQATNLALGKK